MRILILGGTGMLGHKMHDVLSRGHEVVSTTRSPVSSLEVDAGEFFRSGRLIENVDATDMHRLDGLVAGFAPDVVINCVGVVKQRDEAHDPTLAISVNALLPHQLAALSEQHDARLIHFSTDCVFSGARGDYVESDPSDATDLYGRTKYLGEVSNDGALTIRTSIIGRELDHFGSLVEWFLRQRGEVGGFTRAIYTGVTTARLASIVHRILAERPELTGVYQVASEKITKFELLTMIRDRFGLQDRVSIAPDDGLLCDRSLVGDRFSAATGIEVPPWSEMVDELAEDSKRYGSVTT